MLVSFFWMNFVRSLCCKNYVWCTPATWIMCSIYVIFCSVLLVFWLWMNGASFPFFVPFLCLFFSMNRNRSWKILCWKVRGINSEKNGIQLKTKLWRVDVISCACKRQRGKNSVKHIWETSVLLILMSSISSLLMEHQVESLCLGKVHPSVER